MTRKLTQSIVAIAMVAFAGVAARATPPSPSPIFTNVPLARATNDSNGTIPLQAGTDVAMAQITVLPGGHSGWHSHPGGAIVLVKEGSLTVFGSTGSKCDVTTYGAGQAFVERPGEVDNVLNTGTVPYVLFVTFPRVPQGQSPRTDEPDPGTCPGV
jgi:quercetin dioxygenase-like cupin family protein